MDYREMREQVMKSGIFNIARPEIVNETLPFDKDIVFIPIKTRKQAELCFKQGVEVYQRTLPNGMVVLCVPMDFETIINAVSKYTHKF